MTKPKKLRTETYTLPQYWASYLINGDASGIDSDEEVTRIDQWLESHPELGACLDCGNENEFSSRNDAGELPGAVADFTFPIIGKERSK